MIYNKTLKPKVDISADFAQVAIAVVDISNQYTALLVEYETENSTPLPDEEFIESVVGLHEVGGVLSC
jgi:hypothetical protein